MYESQPYYGNLPLLLLFERMDFLRPAILAIWEEPQEQKHVRVLHRMMWYYAAMAGTRREADRLSKQRIQKVTPTSFDGPGVVEQTTADDVDPSIENAYKEDNRPDSNKRYVGSTPLIVECHSPETVRHGPFEEVAEHIRQLYNIDCQNACGVWEYHGGQISEKMTEIVARCECGNVVWTKIMTTNEFAEQAEKILHWKRLADPG